MSLATILIASQNSNDIQFRNSPEIRLTDTERKNLVYLCIDTMENPNNLNPLLKYLKNAVEVEKS